MASALPVGYQQWRRLLFLHWPVAANAIRGRVPRSLTIDQHAGQAYITLIPFVVEAARPLGMPPGLGLDFLETNVRTYVRGPSGEPGIYFFSLDAASLLAVVGARISFGLPYFWAAGRESVRAQNIEYHLRRRGRTSGCCRVAYRVGDYQGAARAGTLDHFLIERYVAYVQRGPSLWSIRVRHEPYPLHDVELLSLTESLTRTAGLGKFGEPELVHFASGVDVAILAPCLIG